MESFSDLIYKLRQHRDLGELSKSGHCLKFELRGITVYECPGDEYLADMTMNDVVKQKQLEHA